MGEEGPDTTGERAQLVDQIDARHEKALRAFFNKKPPKYSFYVPNPALSYLIPRRLLEIEDVDPESVRLIANRCPSSLDIRIATNKDLDAVVCGISHMRHRVAHIDDFDTVDELIGTHVATEFYQRLERLLKRIGFEYLVGENNPDNVSYFTGKLNRQLLHVLPEAEQTKLLGFQCPNQTTTYKKL